VYLATELTSEAEQCYNAPLLNPAQANQPVQCFLEGKGLGIQQGTNVWVGSPKSLETLELKSLLSTT
jgi:hypothetical protein